MSDYFFAYSSYIYMGGVVFVFLVLLAVQTRVNRRSNLRVKELQRAILSLEKDLQKVNKQILEQRSVVVGLGQKAAEQQDVVIHLDERIIALEQEDNDARLYTRATKMVQLGADINEIIQECELPKAEAELMLSLQKKLSGREVIPPLSSHPERRSKPRTSTATTRIQPSVRSKPFE
jgi:hypothetical protein